MGVPQRTCVGCRRTTGQHDLVRVSVNEQGGVRFDVCPERGRSAYLCPRLECLDAAVKRRALPRALRAMVVIDEDARRHFADACALRKA